MKNNLLGKISPAQLEEIKQNSLKFQSDLNWIFDGLCQIDECLTEYCRNSPAIILIEIVGDIREFTSTLKDYKDKGVF